MGFYKAKPTLAEMLDDNPDLLDGLTIPAELDGDVLAGLISVELGDLQTIFEDGVRLAAYLPIWSAAQLPGWNHMYTAMTAQYNPIHNYDRTDTETEEVSGTGSSSFTGSTEASGSDTTTRSRQGFNSADYVPADQDVTELGTRNDSESSTETETGEERSRTLHSAGNIGVTTSQQMIAAELELRNKWTIYSIIVEAFKHDLCVEVW